MATESILSKEIVEIATRGVQQVEAELDRTRRATDKIGTSATQASSFVSRLGSAMMTAFRAPSGLLGGLSAGLKRAKEMMEGVASLSARIAAGGGLGLGGIIAGASRGTVEGERFSQAMEKLVRVLGDAFAPYVRMATSALEGLAGWFKGLSDSTKDSIAQWALITAGVAAFVTLIPVVVAGVASFVGILAALASPAVLAIAAIVALTVAAGMMFGFFETEGADTADSLNESNESWLGALVKGIGAVTVAMAKMFNWIMTQGAKVSDWIAEQMAKAGEFLGIVPKGTLDELRRMPPIQAPQIDVAGVEDFFKKVQRGANEAVADFTELFAAMENIWDVQKRKASGKGFQMKVDVGWENLQGTFDRLQKAMLTMSGQEVDKQILAEEKAANERLEQCLNKLKELVGLFPAVR